jgi:hypothetical protein
MRISHKQIKELQALLLEMTGKEYSPEEAQTTGLAIVRFVSTKELRKHQLNHKEISNGKNEAPAEEK